MLATGVLAVLFFPQLAFPISDGIDPSYAFALSEFATHGVRFGRDVVFTYGPLGCLIFPRPIGLVPAVATAFIGGLWLAFVWTLVRHHATFAPGEAGRVGRWLGWGWVVAVCFFAASQVAPVVNNALVGLVCLWLVLADRHRRWAYAAGAAACVAIAWLAKPSLGVLCLAPLAAYAAYAAWRDRRVAGPLALLAGAALGVVGLWLALYGSLDGFGTYLRSAWEFASGYASAMGTEPAVFWPAIAVFVSALVALPLYLRDRRVNVAYLVFVPAMLGFWRYGTVQSGHFFNFVVVVPIFLALVVPHIRPSRALAGWGLVLMATAALAVDVAVAGVGAAPFGGELATRLRWPGYRFVSQVVRFGPHQRELDALSVERTAARRLPPEALKAIGRSTIDFFPWEMTYAYANELAWRPHPTLQAYTAYTPWLDRLDAAFYAGPDAPTFVAWHATLPSDPMGSIRNRYLLNEEPFAVASMLTHYQPVGRHGDVVLLHRRPDGALDAPRAAGEASVALGDWLDVPASGDDAIVRARVSFDRPPDALWRSAMPGARLYSIDYGLADGRVVARSLPPINAASGVWVQPYVTDFDAAGTRFKGERVRRIRFRCEAPWPQAAAHVTWERLRSRVGAIAALDAQPPR